MTPVVRARRPGEIAFGYVLLLFGLFVFWQAYAISGFESVSSAGVFPMGAGAVMVLSALAVIARNHRRPPAAPEPALAAFRREILPNRIVVFMAILVAYTVALDAAGFVIASVLFLLVSILYLQRSGLVLALIVSIGSIAVIYVLFRVIFTVVLPRGWLLP